MKIIYNDVDITQSVHPLVLQLTDNAGGKADSMTAIFADTDGLWSKWRPSKNDRIRIKVSGYDSGQMFIDHLGQRPGEFEIKSLSIPQECKTARSQGWEEVRFLEIASEIAARYGFRLKTFNAYNYLYKRVDQIEEADFSFLANRCMLEGYELKINDGNLVIYDVSKEEQNIPNERAEIHEYDMRGIFEFVDKSTDIFGKCVVRGQVGGEYTQGEFTDPNVTGPTIFEKHYVSDKAEANRWARGILRNKNMHRVTGRFNIDLQPGLAAGSVVSVKGIGLFDGRYFIHRLIHDLINNRSTLIVRKPLEGY